jgi:hypothetical protein
MRRTTIAAVGLLLAGWGNVLLDGQVYRMSPDGSAVEALASIRESQKTLRVRAEATQDVQPVRDREQSRVRGVIRGLVTSAATGAPVRGAAVRATFASGDSAPQSAVTDNDGAFELSGLAVGSWYLNASKAGFVPRGFGQRGPSGSGTILTVTAGNAVTANIALVRAGAIVGHVFDEFGDPAVGTRVQAMHVVATVDGRRIVPAGVTDFSDDTGAFRLYGLLPGDYLVSARAPTPFDTDTFLVGERMVEQRLFVNGAGVGAAMARPRATASTYFPGTADVGVADRVTIGAGDERTGIDFALTKSSAFRVTGTVIDSSGARPSGVVMVTLNSDSPDQSATFAMSAPTSTADFDFRDVPPGSYTLGVSVPGARTEMAQMPLRVSEDLIGLEIITSPGVALIGTVAGEGGTLPELRGMTVRAMPVSGQRLAFAATTGAVIDGAFQVPNLIGTFRLAVERVPAGWILKAIEIDGVDVTDAPVTFGPGQRPRATVILTNRITEFSGVVTKDGKPVDAAIAVFPDDSATWASTRFVRPLRADGRGMFSVRGLPPHDSYLAVATDYVQESELRDPEFLEQLRSRATAFSLEEGQSRRVNLTFVERSTIDGR